VENRADVVFVGAGIMSLTLATIIRQLEPSWKLVVIEQMPDVAMESSHGWNNAGTGHSALCELNYTPETDDGSIATEKAIEINKQFQISRQFWSWLVESGRIPKPSKFIRQSPHMSLVFGEENIDFLRRRYEALREHPLFAGMEYSEDPREIAKWAPLVVDGRLKSEPIAATRVVSGSDVDFGVLSVELAKQLQQDGVEFYFEHRVADLGRSEAGWNVEVRHQLGETPFWVDANFVFVGAGGAALSLLQNAGIPEIRGYGGFPVSGEWLKCDNEDVVKRHKAKVYGLAEIGAPPMSIPHLDRRSVEDQESVMFGPYAGFTPKFLKNGSFADLFASLRWHNIGPMLAVAVQNLGLLRYLIKEVFASKQKRLEALYRFYPDANPEDWVREVAGQRVQIIKPDRKRVGVLQFGTEVVSSADGSIAGLLGASPGASTAAAIMLEVLEDCFPSRIDGWTETIRQMVPSYRVSGRDHTDVMIQQMFHTASVLKL
jgi:malate dehydrogenase (quinone)